MGGARGFHAPKIGRAKMAQEITQDMLDAWLNSGKTPNFPRRTFRFYTIYAVNAEGAETYYSIPQTSLKKIVAELISQGFKVRSEEEDNPLTGQINPVEISNDHIATPIPYETWRQQTRNAERHNKIEKERARKLNNRPSKMKEPSKVYNRHTNALMFVGTDKECATYALTLIRTGKWKKQDFVFYFSLKTMRKYGML